MRRTVWRNLLIAAAVLSATALTGACAGGAPAGTQTQRTDERPDKTAGDESQVEETKTEAPSQTVAEAGPDGGLVNGYQFIREYGLCGPGNKTAYQMPRDTRPVVEEDGVRATLLAAVYMDGAWRFQVAMEDHTAKLVTPQEAEEIKAREEENRRLQEEGKTLQWDDSYFTVDEEKGLYGRSAYEGRINPEGKAGRQWEFELYVTGSGIPEAGYSANGGTTSSDYAKVPEGGPALKYTESRIEKKSLAAEPPKGTYALHIPGIGQPLEFTLEPAQVYGSPEQIPGVREMADQWIWAVGEREDETVKVSVFSWPKDESRSYRMWIRDIGLKALKGEGAQENTAKSGESEALCQYLPGIAIERDGKSLAAVPNRQPVFYGGFALPDSPDEASYTLTITDPIVTSMEESQLIRLPVSPEPQASDQEIRFAESTIRLAQYERLKEPVFFGYIDEKEDLRPVVSVKTETKNRKPGWELIGIMGHMPGDDPYRLGIMPEYTSDESAMRPSGVKGFKVSCEEGDREVEFCLQNPQYVVHEELTLPVVMEGYEDE